MLCVPAALSAGPALATPYMASSKNVALIPSNNPGKGVNGIMPISSYVAGEPAESFSKFTFSNVGLNQITPATLSKYDTVALIEVKPSALSSAAKAALAQFVANGGKLIIHDADQVFRGDYSWLLPGGFTSGVGASCNACGSRVGTSTITQNSALVSANPADPSYVNLADLGHWTDAIGDSNLFVSNDPRWFAAITGSNVYGSGAQLAYANNNGLIVYNGFDTDMIKTLPTDPWRCSGYVNYLCPPNSRTVDWLAQMWYSELNKSWGTPSGSPSNNGLPTGAPLGSVGTPLPPSQAGLPSNKKCVAKRSLFLRLRRLSGHHHGRVVQVDVYVNGRHRLREKGRLHNVRLTHLPKRGKVVVKIIATTSRGYHLISRVRYHAC